MSDPIEIVGRTWVVPESETELGVIVSTLKCGPMYETMVLGGDFDTIQHLCDNRKEALETHIFWVKYLKNVYGI